MKRSTTARSARKMILLAEDMKALSDELRRRDLTIESALSRITEALIFLLEEKK